MAGEGALAQLTSELLQSTRCIVTGGPAKNWARAEAALRFVHCRSACAASPRDGWRRSGPSEVAHVEDAAAWHMLFRHGLAGEELHPMGPLYWDCCRGASCSAMAYSLYNLAPWGRSYTADAEWLGWLRCRLASLPGAGWLGYYTWGQPWAIQTFGQGLSWYCPRQHCL